MSTQSRAIALAEDVARLFDAKKARATVLMTLLGTLVLGVLLQLAATYYVIADLGALVGGGYSLGWLVLLVLNLALAAAFVLFLQSTVNSFVSTVMALSQRQEALQAVLVPLLRRSALTVTTANLGLGYGVLLGIAVGVFVLPGLFHFALTPRVPFPDLNPLAFLVWVVYGGLLGLFYGYYMEFM